MKKESSLAGYEPKSFEDLKWTLRKVYYQQKLYFDKHQTYTANQSILNLKNKNIQINATDNTFTASGILDDRKYYIREDGKIWFSSINR